MLFFTSPNFSYKRRGEGCRLLFLRVNEKMLMHYLFGGLVASVLMLVLFILLEHRKGNGEAQIEPQADADDHADENGGFAAEVIIVGAGVAGSALAYVLGCDGRRVHVIERNLNELDRICGEFLQPGGYMNLIKLGLKDCVEKIDAQQIFGYAIFREGKGVKIPFPLERSYANVSGWSFINGRFVQRIRDRAATLPNVCLEQGIVTSLLEESGTIKGVSYKNKNGEELKVFAPLTIVCDGNASNLRRNLCIPKVDVLSYSVGLILEKCRLPYPNHGHIILGDHSLIHLYPVSTTKIRCLVDVPGESLPSVANGDLSNYLKTIVAPQIPDELRDAFTSVINNGGRIRSMMNRSMPASPLLTPGAILLGDALNMRSSLHGGGMTVALSDVVLLRELLQPLYALNDMPILSKSFYESREAHAFTNNSIADGMHQIFYALKGEDRRIMFEAFEGYMINGGVFSRSWVAVFSGVDSRPSSFLAHHLLIGIYLFSYLLLPFPSPRRLHIGARMISALLNIILPIIKDGARLALHLHNQDLHR